MTVIIDAKTGVPVKAKNQKLVVVPTLSEIYDIMDSSDYRSIFMFPTVGDFIAYMECMSRNEIVHIREFLGNFFDDLRENSDDLVDEKYDKIADLEEHLGEYSTALRNYFQDMK